jgi:glyoxylase-like metal-dependent hydrolase (beta-lactamase superfamily II)
MQCCRRWTLIAVLLLAAAAGHAAEMTVLPVQGTVHLVAGAGRNVVVQRGDQGLLVVDTGVAAHADKLSATLENLAGNRTIRYVIDTGGGPDAIGGNDKIRKSGTTILGGNVTNDDPRGQQGATVIGHQNVLTRMATSTAESVPEELWPTETFSEAVYDLFFNDEAVQLIHAPAAHSDGDVMVFFRKSDVLVSGNVFDITRYPAIDLERGGNIDGLISALNTIIEITVPRDKQEGGTLVVPAHGRLCDEADVVEYRDMVTIIRDRIRDMISRGLSLEQVRSARPSLDYDGRFGGKDRRGADRFVDAIYKSLNPKQHANR